MKHKSKYISVDDALARLQKYCAYQDRCHKEVRSKLLEIGIYGDDLEGIIVDLIRDDFLNEERFARSYARGKFRMKKWGKMKITRELKMRNISAYCLKKGLSEINEEDYSDTLDGLIEKKRKVTRDKNIWTLKKKVAEFCIRKGYESFLVWDKVHEQIKA